MRINHHDTAGLGRSKPRQTAAATALVILLLAISPAATAAAEPPTSVTELPSQTNDLRSIRPAVLADWASTTSDPYLWWAIELLAGVSEWQEEYGQYVPGTQLVIVWGPMEIPNVSGVFRSASQTIVIGASHRNERPEALAPLIAHEVTHFVDYLFDPSSLSSGEACEAEVRAMRSASITWSVLRPPRPRTALERSHEAYYTAWRNGTLRELVARNYRRVCGWYQPAQPGAPAPRLGPSATPESKKESLVTTNDLFHEIYTLSGEGSLGLNMTLKLAQAAVDLHLDYSILSAGGLDDNRSTVSHLAVPAFLRSKYLGLSPEEAQQTSGYLADQERAQASRADRDALHTQANAKQVDAMRERGLKSPFEIFVHSWTGGHSRPAKERLEGLNKLISSAVRLGVTNLSHEKYLRDAIAEDHRFPLQLAEEGLVTAELLFDDLSLIVMRYGRPFQDQLIARALVSLLGGILVFANQRGPADAVMAMARYEKQIGLSFGLRYTLADPQSLAWRVPSKLFGLGSRGKGRLDDFIAQTIAAIEDAIHDPQWRAIDEDISPDKQAFVTLIEPIRSSDFRQSALFTAVEEWLSRHHPWITAIWVPGPGTPHPELAHRSPYRIQASLFYPLRPIPRAVQRIRDQVAAARGAGKAPSTNNQRHDGAALKQTSSIPG
jgi:hypothetical protein